MEPSILIWNADSQPASHTPGHMPHPKRYLTRLNSSARAQIQDPNYWKQSKQLSMVPTAALWVFSPTSLTHCQNLPVGSPSDTDELLSACNIVLISSLFLSYPKRFISSVILHQNSFSDIHGLGLNLCFFSPLIMEGSV